MVQARQEGQGEIVLYETPDGKTARKYWNKLKERLGKEGNQSVTICHRLIACRRWQELPHRRGYRQTQRLESLY